eukprot:TRINITY_DN3947_c0_g1_i1.p2 TRINITY_DN3947_c0_g1~~TRINITY_DN3947_c0_g1_i1.p2  ORF type:complete len:473 (+),score=240.27 TRINITY_DN3947_c0_g1_i1:299-1717(+)
MIFPKLALLAATAASAATAATAGPVVREVAKPLHAGCHSPAPWDRYIGDANNFATQDFGAARKMVREVPNGRLYTVVQNAAGTNGTVPATFYVAHVWGTPEDWGTAQGQLYGEIARTFFDDMWKYIQLQVEQAIPHFPKFLQELIETYGLEIALGITYEATRKYTDPALFIEMKALAAASGTTFEKVLYMHMIAGLTQGKCSMTGAWGDAVAAGEGLVQFRALDWDMDAPVRNFSAVTVYHPSDPKYGHAHALVGMVGFGGALSGMSETQLAISEIGVSFPTPDAFGKESRSGVPFVFILREILMRDNTIDDSISRMAMAKRTCDLILGVGDGKLREFRGFAYSATQLHVIDSENLIPANDTWHPKLNSTVYFGMDWECPSYNYVLHRQLKANHGNIKSATLINDVMSRVQTGDNHIAVYSFTGDRATTTMDVSFSAPLGAPKDGLIAAYDRQYTRFTFEDLFDEKPPTQFS